MLDQLQSKTNAVVVAMTQTQEKSTEGLETSHEAVNALLQVEQSVTMINDMNIQIAAATEEQRTVCKEINRNMVQIQNQSDVVQEQSQKASSLGKELGEVARKNSTIPCCSVHHLIPIAMAMYQLGVAIIVVGLANGLTHYFVARNGLIILIKTGVVMGYAFG